MITYTARIYANGSVEVYDGDRYAGGHYAENHPLGMLPLATVPVKAERSLHAIRLARTQSLHLSPGHYSAMTVAPIQYRPFAVWGGNGLQWLSMAQWLECQRVQARFGRHFPADFTLAEAEEEDSACRWWDRVQELERED